MPHQCPTNDEGNPEHEIPMAKCSTFLRHWWGIGGAFVIPTGGSLLILRLPENPSLFLLQLPNTALTL